MALDLSILQSNSNLILFLFVFAIVFGVIEVTRIFRNRGVNFLISLAISFFATANPAFVTFIEPQLGNVAIFFIFMFFIVFVFEVFGLRGVRKREPEEGMIINGAILLILLIFGFMHADLIPELPLVGNGTNFIVLVVLVFILVIFWAAFKAGREELPQAAQGRK